MAFQILPAPTPDPWGMANAQAFQDMIDTLGRFEAARQRRQMTTKILEGKAQGKTIQEIAQDPAFLKPTFSTGIPGFFQRIAAPFAQTQGAGIQDIITGEMLKQDLAQLSPSQQISQKKLDKINQLQAKVTAGTATKAEQAILDKMLVGVSSSQPFTQGRIEQTLGELEAGGAKDMLGMVIEFGSRKDAVNHALRRLGPKWKELAPEAEEIIDRKWPEESEFKIGQTIVNPTTGERRRWNGKKWLPIR